MSTIDNKTITQTVTLGLADSYPTYASPLTVTATGAVEASSGPAILGPTGNAWTVINQGTVTAPIYGLRLLHGGYVGNLGGLIQGGSGVSIDGALGTVTNSGTIDGTGTYAGVVLEAGGNVGNTAGLIEGYRGVLIVGAPGTIANSGTSATIEGTGTAVGAIYLNDGGTVTNSGMIAGALSGVDVAGASGTVVNTGTIEGTSTTGFQVTGMSLYGGTITNGASDETTALIQGAQYGAEIGNTAGVVTNFGMIAATAIGGEGVRLVVGGTIDNLGTIEGPGAGLYLDSATSVINGQSGSIAGYIAGQTGVSMAGPGTVTNYGRIAGAAGQSAGVNMVRGGTVLNFGTITAAGTAGAGVGFGFLNAGGIVVNGQSGSTAGLITGGNVGVSAEVSGGTVTNFGTIVGGIDGAAMTGSVAVVVDNFGSIGGGSHGAYLGGGAGATLVNSGSGMITGGAEGVHGRDAAGTVSNSGTIEGDTGNAIDLTDGGTVTNHGLILSPNTTQAAIFISNAAGSVANYGTVAGGTGILITYLAGTVTNAGTIVATGQAGRGVDLHSGGTVDNSGLITATGPNGAYGVYLLNGGVVSNTGSIKSETSGAGVYLVNGGSVGNVGSTALISGIVYGVMIAGAAGTVTNAGTIADVGTYGAGVKLQAGGLVDNGASGATVGLIEGPTSGVVLSGASGTIVNFGTIETIATYPNPVGVYISAGGSLINYGLVKGYIGVAIAHAAAPILNFGTISGTFFYGIASYGALSGGVYSAVGVNLTNAAAGVIAGRRGGISTARSASSTVINFGTIAGTAGYPIDVILRGGGTVVNYGTISGGLKGIEIQEGGTVIDSGTISGAGGTAVYFGGGANLLALAPGYALGGTVVAYASSSSTLELAGSLGAPLTVNYNALGLRNFQDVLFGAGGYDTLKVSNTGGTLGATISGFDQSNQIIDLTGIGTDGTISNFDSVNNLITITGTRVAETLQLDASDGTSFTTQSDGANGTDLLIACFCRGTLILTDKGEVAVEELAIGDSVVTVTGEARPVRWIGRRAYDGRFIAGNRNVLPIRVTAGALAPGVPARDLWVSPEHSLYFDDVLVEAKHLVNDATIVQSESVERVEYFHVELDSHDIIIADGAAAESYVDDDNRMMFANGAEYFGLYPDDERSRGQFCLPRLEWGCERLTAIRAVLWRRAEELGYVLDQNADFHLVVDGQILRPDDTSGATYRFMIPAGSGAVWLASHSAVPTELDAGTSDFRRLGVPVERLVLSDRALTIEARHDHDGLSQGFHGDEPTHRWTDGMARLPDMLLRPFAGAVALRVHLTGNGLSYPLAVTRAKAARRRRRIARLPR